MDGIWEKEYCLRTSDFDRYSRLRAFTVLDLFQDAAGEHAERLGIGREALRKKGLLWVVARVKFVFAGEVGVYERVRVRTWPLPAGRASAERCYRLFRQDGSELAAGCSEWVLMDAESRRLVPTQRLEMRQEALCTQRVFPEERLRRVPDFPADGEGRLCRPGFSALDLNGHVNNARYADFVADAVRLRPEERLRSCQIDYRREVLEEEALCLHVCRTGERILVKGVNDAGETMFACEMGTEKE